MYNMGTTAWCNTGIAQGSSRAMERKNSPERKLLTKNCLKARVICKFAKKNKNSTTLTLDTEIRKLFVVLLIFLFGTENKLVW